MMPPTRYIDTYNHQNRVGVLIELECSDDFTARTDQLRTLARDLCLQIAASAPSYATAAEVGSEHWQDYLLRFREPLSRLDAVERRARERALREEFEAARCLLSQPFIKNPAVSVAAHVASVAAALQTDVNIVRFVRYASFES